MKLNKMKKYRSLWALSLGLAFVPSVAGAQDAAPAQPATDSALPETGRSAENKEMDKYITQQEFNVSTAQDNLTKAIEFFRQNNYEKAIESALTAKESLNKCNQANPKVHKFQQDADQAISLYYRTWAQELISDADSFYNQNAKPEEARMAIQNLLKAKDTYPQCAPEVDEKLKQWSNILDGQRFKNETSFEFIGKELESNPGTKRFDFDYKAQMRKIAVLQQRGMVFYKNKQYDQARMQFLEIFKYDPTNIEAANALRLVDQEILRSAERRAKASREHDLAEVAGKMVRPLPAVVTSRGDNSLSAISGQAFEKRELFPLEKAIEDVKIDYYELDGKNLRQAIQELEDRIQKSDIGKELALAGTPVNFIVNLQLPNTGDGEAVEGEEAPETSSADAFYMLPYYQTSNASVKKILDELCMKFEGDLSYEIDDHAITVFSSAAPLDELQTRVWIIEGEAMSINEDKDALKEQIRSEFGVRMPKSSSAKYDAKSRRLFVTNTQANLDAIDKYIQEHMVIPKQILIETRFVEVKQRDLQELGFDWTYKKSGSSIDSDGTAPSVSAGGSVQQFIESKNIDGYSLLNNATQAGQTQIGYLNSIYGVYNTQTGGNQTSILGVGAYSMDGKIVQGWNDASGYYAAYYNGNTNIFSTTYVPQNNNVGGVNQIFPAGNDPLGNRWTAISWQNYTQAQAYYLNGATPANFTIKTTAVVNQPINILKPNINRSVAWDGIGSVNTGTYGTTSNASDGNNDAMLQYTTQIGGKEGYEAGVVMRALNQASSADVLSTPRITVKNGEEGIIDMVERRYFPTNWSEPLVNTFGGNGNNGQIIAGNGIRPAIGIVGSIPELDEETRLGIHLEVKPEIDESDGETILMTISPSVKSFLDWDTYSIAYDVDGDGIVNKLAGEEQVLKMPIIEARTVTNVIRVSDGGTILMAGALRDKTYTMRDQIPFLGDIPILGRAFRTDAKSVSSTNLLIFLTASVINPDGTFVNQDRRLDVVGAKQFHWEVDEAAAPTADR